MDSVDYKLTNACRLEDPFLGFNEIKAEWVGEEKWTYKTSISRPQEAAFDATIVLSFDGLDTFADIKIDGVTVHQSDNMFLPHRIDITNHLDDDGEHVLSIDFDSALLKAREIKSKHPEHKWVGFNGDMARLAVRKAQYHWGWDWGPILMCAGIWRPARLEVYHARISDLRADLELSKDHKTALVKVSTSIEGSVKDLKVKISINLRGQEISHVLAEVAIETLKAEATLEVKNPSLWFPNGAWIELMVPANQKMIRVWGGGIYEDDAFYDACDELGILVWQDFMFGCGNYPAFDSILGSITAEAIANVRRIRHHPSIVIFAGNNEDYQVQEQYGLHYNYSDKNSKNWLKCDFPARYIYEKVLPEVVSAEAPLIPYHPGSPWGDGKISSDPTVGDMHQWNVWHGTQEKYQIFDSLGGRFNSEFGMEAFPHLATIESFVTDPKDLYPQSHVLDFHNKADGHERRIATYLVENVRTATSLKAYIHLTQLIQAEALMFGYRGWRKQWGDSRRCGGALVWQLNDCWPVTSWSICDYYLRRKPAYYAMARVLAPIAIGVRRAHHDWSVTHARQPEKTDWECWVVSSKLEPVKADIEVQFISVATGKQLQNPIVKKGVTITPNGTTDLLGGTIHNFTQEPHVLAARIWVAGHLIARDTDWPQPLKYLDFNSRGLKIEDQNTGKKSVKGEPISQYHISVDRPVKCLVFEERQGCHLSDSAIDVVPGDDQIVEVRGVGDKEKPLEWTFLGDGE
ncbi:hypothetical protein UCRPC4_g00407 [Phaeomoniella chlamydospora]|uniref:Beta-mannosidase B n=1 Tax=Phaeomoniella chlamydospora TaxID=158046 RepID=A0A0G2F1B5_PHACM|nr:hypothetical protein UCRPC4_g00407 [Phaeomoniella chlamydospora]